MTFPSDNLMSLADTAKYCGRTAQLFRKYYSEGLLPEPAYRVHYGNGTRVLRKFTVQEAENLKTLFAKAHYGDFEARRRRAQQSRVG